jgi:hypothetical protein
MQNRGKQRQKVALRINKTQRREGDMVFLWLDIIFRSDHIVDPYIRIFISTVYTRTYFLY